MLATGRAPQPGRDDVARPELVTIPPALRARVLRVELSGLAWAPTLERYLAVIDDSIDLETGNRRAPFVLALDRSGRLDAEPVPLDGVRSLDDAESLAAGPEGTFFLLTSHSLTRHGKTRQARRQLLQLRLEGRRLRATGVLDLLQGPHDVSHQLHEAGFGLETPVDLEGVAFHEGNLYLGLKAPLLPDGSAIILRLERPMEAFARGSLDEHALSLWARIKLGVVPPTGGGLVFQGIADLLFGADGALYLCANAPKGWPADGGGSLWKGALPPRAGTLNGAILRRFPGLHPEGVAPDPGGHALTLVFDRNDRDPLWMTWPLVHRPEVRDARQIGP